MMNQFGCGPGPARCAIAALCLLLGPTTLTAEVRLPYILADHMVVQRDRPVHVWGMASPGEQVAATFRAEKRSTTTDELGRWSLYFSPAPAGGPFDIVITASNTISLKDVLVGDIWIAAGQSNMEWPVRWSADPKQEIASARYPTLRLVRTMHRVSGYPVSQFVGQPWAPCTPQSVEHFSAVAYHFARNLQARTKVPVGIIQTAWGGTPIEAWTPLAAIADDPGLMPLYAEWAKLTAQHEANLLEYPKRLSAWNAAGRPGERPELRRRPGGQWTPAGLFNAMVAPLTKMPIRGVIWYQGEANAAPERAPLYRRLFPAMIRGWRAAWNQGDFPFLFVQLANYRGAEDAMWPEIREAQRQALKLSATAMAVTIDIGNPTDIHPRNKRDVGYRLSLAARAIAYGEPLVYSGPLFRRATREGRALRVWFDFTGGGLIAKGGLSGFEVAGPDEKFAPAEARIDGSTVVVSSEQVPEPRLVRYAWRDNPESTLSNAEGLPSSPFVSDNL